MIRSLSNYHLLFELLHNGEGNIHPNLEPIDIKQIIKILEKRSNKAFSGDIKNIIDWFLETEGVASEKEKKGITTVLKIKNIEKKSLKKLKNKIP